MEAYKANILMSERSSYNKIQSKNYFLQYKWYVGYSCPIFEYFSQQSISTCSIVGGRFTPQGFLFRESPLLLRILLATLFNLSFMANGSVIPPPPPHPPRPCLTNFCSKSQLSNQFIQLSYFFQSWGRTRLENGIKN